MPLWLAFVVLPVLSGQETGRIQVVDAGGEVRGGFQVAADDRWCLVWNHSVTGFEVRDCFVHRPPHMLLEYSLQPDFAAGLGHVEGRGEMVSDGEGGYRIERIDEVVPGGVLRLRVGSAAVDHRIEHGAGTLSLSPDFAHRRMEIRYVSP